ncbi:MAG: VCBS repeat-containing protein [Melioribacteraceae bacterium]|nr:VCBS repeat-containing protein [Melioribacteraceae bacterium]
MKKTLLILKFILLFNTVLLSNGVDSVYSVWTNDKLPSAGRIRNLTFINANEGFALSDNILLHFKNDKWELFTYQPPLKSVSFFIAENENSIWLTGEINTYESILLHYNGIKWERIEHPIMNQIRCADITEKYFGGDREIVRFENGEWNFIEYPSTPRSTKKMVFYNNELFFLSDAGELFKKGKNYWEVLLENEFVREIRKTEDSLFFITNNKILKLEQTKINEVYNSQSAIRSIDIINSKNFAVITEDNKVFIQNNLFNKTISFTGEKLYDVKLNNNTVWLVSDTRQILRNKEGHFPVQKNNDIDFTSQSPITFFYELQNEYGVAMDDLDGDGLKDIYSVCIMEPNRAYFNKGNIDNNLILREEAVKRGITGITGDTLTIGLREIYLGIGMADVDNDNDKDIYLCDLIGNNKLFLNNGAGKFRNVSEQKNRATELNTRANSSTFADVDLDGDLDMFITNEYRSNQLFLNDGNGYFEDITDVSGLTTKWGGMTASFADFDNDNDPDLFVTTWGLCNLLYENVSSNGEIKFIDISKSAGVCGNNYTKSNAVVWEDLNNDGFVDLFITNRKTSNKLFINNHDKTFTDATKAIIGEDKDLSYGVSIADFDNDGFNDIYVANIGENNIYKNLNGEKFKKLSLAIEKGNNGYSTGTAAGDIDNDGDIDLYVASYVNEGSKILVNSCNNNNFIKLNIIGTRSNSDAVGVKVFLEKLNHDSEYEFYGYKEICSGSGYASHSSTEVHFGISPNDKYRARIYYPASGITKYIDDIKTGTTYKIYEEEGSDYYFTNFSKTVAKLLTDWELIDEEIKFLCFFIITMFSIRRTRISFQWKYRNIVLLHFAGFLLYIFLVSVFLFETGILFSILPLMSFIVYLSMIHLYFEKIILARAAENERRLIRENIARDLHDDLASTISSAAIYSDFLSNHINENGNKKKIADKLKELMAEAANSISETIWVVSTYEDKATELINRIVDYVKENATSMDLEPIIDLNINKNDKKIDSRIKRNIFLIVKEAFNNIIKYSNTKKILLKIDYDNNILEIILEDFGNGFEFSDDDILAFKGNGIKNMYKRAGEINGKLKIYSRAGTGTKVSFRFKLTQTGY